MKSVDGVFYKTGRERNHGPGMLWKLLFFICNLVWIVFFFLLLQETQELRRIAAVNECVRLAGERHGSPSTVINIFVDSLLVIVFISPVFSTNVTLTFDDALEKRMQVARMKNHPRIPETYAEMMDILNKYSKYG